MSAEPGPRLVCERCGSSHLRNSRPHGIAERLERRNHGVRFHVCRECGARGSHVGRRSPPGRPVEPRDVRARRARALRRTLAALVAILLGAGIAYYATSCEPERPTIEERR